MTATTPHEPAVPIAIYGAILLFVIGRFLVRELRERKLALGRIFVAPCILGALAVWLLYFSFSYYHAEATLLAGETLVTIAIGSGIGLAVGHFTTVRLGEKPGVAYVLGNRQTVAIWIGALILRFAARFVFGHNDVATQFSLNAALVMMIAAALALLRYRILVDARALRERGITTPVPVV